MTHKFSLKSLLGESFEEYYLTKENKKKFLEDVAKFNEFNTTIYRDGDLKEIAKKVTEIGKIAEHVAMTRIDDWFDGQSVRRDMKALAESTGIFEKTCKDMYMLQQRLESVYEEIGNRLSKYFDINDGEVIADGKKKVTCEDDLTPRSPNVGDNGPTMESIKYNESIINDLIFEDIYFKNVYTTLQTKYTDVQAKEVLFNTHIVGNKVNEAKYLNYNQLNEEYNSGDKLKAKRNIIGIGFGVVIHKGDKVTVDQVNPDGSLNFTDVPDHYGPFNPEDFTILKEEITSHGIKVGDTVKVLAINDHTGEKYDIGDTFKVKYIVNTGSDNALYVADDKKYPFHPQDVKVIKK